MLSAPELPLLLGKIALLSVVILLAARRLAATISPTVSPPRWASLFGVIPVIGPVVQWGFERRGIRGASAIERATKPPVTPREAKRVLENLLPRRARGIILDEETRRTATAHYVLRNFEAALPLFREYREAHPDEERVAYYHGIAALVLKKYKEAIESLQDLVAINPKFDRGLALLLLGHAFKGFDDPERAEMAYKMCLDQEDEPEALVALAELRLKAGDLPGARDYWREASRNPAQATRRQLGNARYWASIAEQRLAEHRDEPT